MKRLFLILLCILFVGCAGMQKKSYTGIFAKSGLNVDVDSNDAVDLEYGGTNQKTAAAAADALGAAMTATGADAIAGTITATDWVTAAMIDWDDIQYLGEGGLPNNFTLTGNADAGDNSVTSISKLEGFDAAVYLDIGTDGTFAGVADTLLTLQSPDIRFQVDALAYLKIVTGDGGITTISQVSDGTDGITIGDDDDNIIIAGDNIDVDTSGNMTLGGALTVASSATPTISGYDSDQADDQVMEIVANGDGTDSDVTHKAQVGDAMVEFLRLDGQDEKVVVSKPIDVGANAIDTTGLVTGGVKTVVDADGGEVDAYCYGGLWYASGTGTLLLPAIAAGMQITVENHTDLDVLIDPDGTEIIRLNGTALGAGVAITGTDLGDGCVCTYYAASTWSCFCSGYE